MDWIDIVGDIGTVRAYSHSQFHDVELGIQVNLFFFKDFPETALKLISPHIVFSRLFPIEIVQGLQHVFLTIDKVTE